MVDHLWAPWRLEYVKTNTHDAECVFCKALGPGAIDPFVVFQGRLAYVILNRYPYNNGHVMVVPHRHVATLTALTPEELQEVALLTQRSEAVLREVYEVGGINVGLNLGKPAGGGVLYHLHVHLVPRWVGDTNFMTVIGETRVLSEDLGSAGERLRPVFERLSAEA